MAGGIGLEENQVSDRSVSGIVFLTNSLAAEGGDFTWMPGR